MMAPKDETSDTRHEFRTLALFLTQQNSSANSFYKN
jgi:hypothetical protein